MSKNYLFKVANIILISTIILVLVNCSSDKNTGKTPYKAGGIIINYYAESNLNTYDETSHSLMLGIYQLDNINGFMQLSKDLPGTQKLLGLTKFDQSVQGVDTKFIYADESGTFVLDRLENTHWIAIVAGYYNIIPQQVVKQFEVPENLNHDLTINILLNADSIQELKNK